MRFWVNTITSFFVGFILFGVVVSAHDAWLAGVIGFMAFIASYSTLRGEG